MIIWSGRGILIVLFAALGFMGGAMVGGAFGSAKWGVVLSLAGSAAALWLFALTVGKTQVTELLDPATGSPVRLTKRHTLFFLPPKFWSVAATGVALFSILIPGDFTERIARDTDAKAPSPGRAAFKAADGLLTTSSNGTVHGNTPEAQALAGAFSAALKEIRKETIEKRRASGPSLTKGEFLTYCLLREEGCVFMVHVPQLRKFSADAKAFIADAGWAVALQVLEESGMKPEVVAVGVRGSLFYDRVIVGKAGPVEDHEELILRTAKGNSDSVDELAAQFEAALKAPPPVAAEARPPAKAASVMPGTKSGPPEPAQVAVAPGAGDGKAEPEAAPPRTPVPAASSQTPDTEAATNTASASSAPEPAAAAAQEPIDAMRTWTDTSGRTMKAAFVRFVTPAKDSAEFKREDGQIFVVPLARFSMADQDFVKGNASAQD